MQKFKRCYIIVLVIAIFSTVFGQIFLLNDSFRNKISSVYKMESRYVYSEQQLPRGTVVIRVSMPSEGLYLLQNGEPVAELTQSQFTIDILDNMVIEVDGRNCGDKIYVNVESVSKNVDGFYEEQIYVEGNIAILGRFFVK